MFSGELRLWYFFAIYKKLTHSFTVSLLTPTTLVGQHITKQKHLQLFLIFLYILKTPLTGQHFC